MAFHVFIFIQVEVSVNSSPPFLPSPFTPPTTVSFSLVAENLSNSISASLDLHVPLRLTPLYLAVLLNDPVFVHLFSGVVVPLIGKIAPSDTYKIRKRDGNLMRTDMTLKGFDGLKIQSNRNGFRGKNGLSVCE
ncbi:hypothetical protein Droror1_Dr00023130 [Drosera rotundifolia]